MFTRMLAPLALVVAGTMQPPLMVQEPTLHPVCIWQSGDYEDVVDGLMQCGDVDWDAEKRAVHALSEHERRHGWGGRIGGTDMIPASANVPCPARALEFFLQLTSACAEGEATWVQLEFADVLARNGRTDDALTVLNFGAHVRPSVTAHWYHGFFFNDDRWIAAHVAANIAAQAGRWEDALRFSQEWRPTGGCGNCMESEQRRIELFRAQCLVHLQRWGELRAACIDNLNDSWSSNSLLVGPWIDSYLLSGEAPDPETAVSILLPFVDARQCSRLDGAAEEWKLLHLPKAQQVQRLAELAELDSETAFSRLLECDLETVSKLAKAIRVESGNLPSYGLAHALAATGLDVVGVAIAGAELELGAEQNDSLKYLREAWEDARDQRALLTRQ